MGKYRYIFLITVFLSCSLLNPSIKRCSDLYQKAHSQERAERVSIYEEIVETMYPYIEKQTALSKPYVLYINSLYNLALFDHENRQYYYELACTASALWVGRTNQDPFAHYFHAKSLYLIESEDTQIVDRIIINARTALNLLDKRYAPEIREMKEILKELGDIH